MSQQQTDQNHFWVIRIKRLLNCLTVDSFSKCTAPKCGCTHGLQLEP
jgi:hypothetical protein